MDYYAILGVHPTAEDVVIRAAFKALAQRYHPDRFTGSQDEAHRRMSELTKAYEVLADPGRRSKYDRRRLTYTQSVANYFNAGPPDSPLIFDPRIRRSAAAMRRRSRVALAALMTAVIVLSVFNVVQYSAQLKEWIGVGAPSASTVDAHAHAAADARTAAAATSVAGIRNLPITPPNPPAATPAPAPVAVESAPADATAIRGPAADETTATRTGPATAAPARAKETAEARTPPLVPAAGRIEPAVAAASAPLPPPQDARPTAPRAAAGPTSAPTPPPTATPPAVAPAPCTDSVAALGLCSPQTTARNP